MSLLQLLAKLGRGPAAAPAAAGAQPAQPGVFDRIMTGILGQPNNYGGLLDPAAQRQAGSDGRTALFASLLQASGPSSQRIGLGQALGGAMLAGRQAQQDSLSSALQANLLQSQITRNNRGDLPTSAEEYEYFKKLPPEEQKIYQEMRAKSGPAAIQEFQYFKSLPPEDQATYIKLQRQPTVPKVVMIGNVPHLVDPVTGTRTPLSSLEQEATGAATVKGAEAQAQAFGRVAGEIAANIQKKGSDAKGAQSTLEGADALIDIATGSAAGNARDKFIGLFGYSTNAGDALAELKVLQANLMLQQPRMEGPQSDRDVQLYREAAASLGDPNVPASQKKAALRRIVELQNKYIERAATAAPAPSAAPASGGVVNFEDLK